MRTMLTGHYCLLGPRAFRGWGLEATNLERSPRGATAGGLRGWLVPTGLPAMRIRSSVWGMASSINRVELLGNLGGDAEFKQRPDGTVLAQFRLATGRRWLDGGGNWAQETEWHDIVVWKAAWLRGRLAKGDKVYVTGRLRTRSWEKDGVTVRRTEVVCGGSGVIPLVSKAAAAGPATAARVGAQQPITAAAPSGGHDDDMQN